MTTVTHEQTINTALAEVIERFGREWRIRPEEVGGVFEGGGRPDILIEKPDGWPIAIEAEVGNHRQAEREAQSRLRRRIASTGREVHASVALVYSADMRAHQGGALRDALADTEFEYALYTVEADNSSSRFPEAGWIVGAIAELAILLHRSSIPACSAPGSLDTSLSHAAGLIEIAACHA